MKQMQFKFKQDKFDNLILMSNGSPTISFTP